LVLMLSLVCRFDALESNSSHLSRAQSWLAIGGVESLNWWGIVCL
jgi:hypothetical protein